MKSSLRRLRRQITADPFSVEKRTSYLAKCKEYKKLIKAKQRHFKNELVSKLATLAREDPNAFWSTLKNIRRNSDDRDSSNNITPSEWQQHFSKLGGTIPEVLRENRDLLDELTLLESTRGDEIQTALDHPVTIREIKDIIKSLKNNKAQGDDLIANEMLKFGAPVMLPAMVKLFNIILDSGIFPTAWNKTYQVPIYKKGDPLNCNNYSTGGSALPVV